MVRTHHGRQGGRSLELLLGLAALVATLALIVGGAVATVGVIRLLGLEASRAGNLAIVGAIVGGCASRPIWTALLRHYRYDRDLRPIIEKDGPP